VYNNKCENFSLDHQAYCRQSCW